MVEEEDENDKDVPPLAHRDDSSSGWNYQQ
jgi:hypothetical protein